MTFLTKVKLSSYVGSVGDNDKFDWLYRLSESSRDAHHASQSSPSFVCWCDVERGRDVSRRRRRGWVTKAEDRRRPEAPWQRRQHFLGLPAGKRWTSRRPSSVRTARWATGVSSGLLRQIILDRLHNSWPLQVKLILFWAWMLNTLICSLRLFEIGDRFPTLHKLTTKHIICAPIFLLF